MGNVSNFFKDAWNTVSRHSPEILTGIGIAGMITTTVLAVKATPKALRKIEERKKAEGVEKLKAVDTVKAAWKCYIPAAVTGVASTTCLICAQAESNRRNAALAAAYKISETALTEYREKVIETIGEKKEATVREKVAQDRVKEHMANNTEVYITEKGETLFLDPLSHRTFKSDIELIRRAVNNLNYELTTSIMGYVSLNEFYDEIGLPRTTMGDKIGWNLDNGKGLIKIDTIPVKENEQPCLCLDYLVEPNYNYMDYYR